MNLNTFAETTLPNDVANLATEDQPSAASVDELVAKIQSAEDRVRGPAWQTAGPAGAPAIKPLAALMTQADFEVARAAKRAIYRIIRHAGRPGAEKEAAAVASELVLLLKNSEATVRREALWMLSEIGDESVVAPMAALLADAIAREDARCALLRLPGPKVTAAFKIAFDQAPEEFKFALADSLRQLGEKVDGYPSRRLVPTRK